MVLVCVTDCQKVFFVIIHPFRLLKVITTQWTLKGLDPHMVLTGDGAQVEVVPYDLLELMVQRTLLKLQTEVVAQVRVQHFTYRKRDKGKVRINPTAAVLPLRRLIS